VTRKGRQTVNTRDDQSATTPPHQPPHLRSNMPTDAPTDRAEVLAEHIRQLVDTAPPLSAEQIQQLRGLLPAPTTQPSDLNATAPKTRHTPERYPRASDPRPAYRHRIVTRCATPPRPLTTVIEPNSNRSTSRRAETAARFQR
jgi:hypothetical protein